MSSTKNPGRVAGLYYLLLIALGPLFLIYIPDKLYVKGNATATVSNVAAHERLFRVGIFAELLGGVLLVLLVLAFYRLFHGVDPHLASPCWRMALAIGNAGVPVAFPPALLRRLAWYRWRRLVDLELCGDIRTRISKQTFRHSSARLFRGDSPHAVARDQGR
jgi:Domain of unknown function (DUF4386)